MPTRKPAADPKDAIKARTQEIIRIAADFCRAHLDDEYAALCEKLVLKMSRKRAIPYVAGRPEIWAGAVVYALGQINFLFDPTQTPHTTQSAIAEHFGTTTSTLGQKAKSIRDLFKLRQWDPEFSTQAMAANNPYDRLVMVNGLIVPRDMLPMLIELPSRKS